MFSAQGISLSLLVMGTIQKIQRDLYYEGSSSDNYQLVQLSGSPVNSCFVIYKKKLEEMEFADEEFLRKKINNKDVYMWIMVCYRSRKTGRCSRGCMRLRQYGDVTALNSNR